MDKIGPALAERLDSAQDHDVFEVSIFLAGNPAEMSARPAGLTEDAAATGAARVDRMRSAAEASQAGLVEFLHGERSQALLMDDGSAVPQVGKVERFWINNSVTAELSRDALRRVLERDDVEHVELVRRAPLSELLDDMDWAPRVTGKTALPAGLADDAAPAPTWSVTKVNAPLLWQLGIRGERVLVAVIDSGVNYDHPDLKGRMWTTAAFPNHGRDFENGDDDPTDENGHGTCCAGIVAGEGALGKGTGVAPAATVMAVRVGGSESQFWAGMQFAIDQGAHVISMSMSWKFPRHPNYPGWRRICEAIHAAGILHANSIGNQGDDLVTYPIPHNIATPGDCPPPWLHPLQQPAGGVSSAISCGATDSGDALASYSGRGPAAWETSPYLDYPHHAGQAPGLIKPDICAPGPGTESCSHLYKPGGTAKPYVSFGGTSSATPHVAGCLTLIASACLAKGVAIVPARVQEAIESTARKAVGQTRAKEIHYGSGRIDVYAAHRFGVAKGWW